MKPATLQRIRTTLWIYFWLLIFEGALRKWFLPSLSAPLAIIRDPIALYALFLGWPLVWRKPWIQWLKPLFYIVVIGFVLAILVGHGDFVVAYFGARIYLWHFALIFLYASVFDRSDVMRFGIAALILSIPMTLLMVAQSNAPDTHILNIGPGGEGIASFQGAMGRSRPPGTFSFISGVVLFYGLSTASLFSLLYGFKPGLYAKILASFSGIAIVLALPVSISRSLLAAIIMVSTTLLIGLVLARIPISRFLYGILALALAIYFATMIPIFKVTSEAFIARWTDAGINSGSDRSSDGDVGVARDQVTGRILPGFTDPLKHAWNSPLLGNGIGMGSNMASSRLPGGLQPLGEGSWEITVGELGPLLGVALLFWRVSLAIWIFRLSLRAALSSNIIPIIFIGATFLPLLNGQVTQPTTLGFVVLVTGLNLAAFNQFQATSNIHQPS
jgi:hypothetical protein